jgi:hypothetical protein
MCKAGFLASQDIGKRGNQYAVATTTFVNSKAESEAKMLERGTVLCFRHTAKRPKGGKVLDALDLDLDQPSRTF